MFVRSLPGISLSMEFVSVDSVTLCKENYHRKLQWRAVAGWYHWREIRADAPRIRMSLQNCRVYIPTSHESPQHEHCLARS